MSEFYNIRVEDLFPLLDDPSQELALIQETHDGVCSATESRTSQFEHTAGQRSQLQAESCLGQPATTQLNNGCPKDSHYTSQKLQKLSESSNFQSFEVAAITQSIPPPFDYQYQVREEFAVSYASSEWNTTSETIQLQPPIAEVTPTETCCSLLPSQWFQLPAESYTGQPITTEPDKGYSNSHDSSLEWQNTSESLIFRSSEIEASTQSSFPFDNQYWHDDQFPKESQFEWHPASENTAFQPPTSVTTQTETYNSLLASGEGRSQETNCLDQLSTNDFVSLHFAQLFFPEEWPSVEMSSTLESKEMLSSVTETADTYINLSSDKQQLSKPVLKEGLPAKFKFDPEQRADCLYSPAAVASLQSIPECKVMASDTDTGGFNQSNFKKPEDNSMSEVALSSYLRAMQSVGALIRNGQLVGTVFRVGTCYVMTAWHCIDSITYDPFRTQQRLFQKLQDTNVFILFSPSLTTPTEKNFYIEQLCYYDESLDVAVLKIINHSGLQPDPSESLKLCRNLISVDDCPRANIIGFGHPTNQSKILDHSCKIISPDDQSVTNARRWFQEEESRLATALQEQAGKKPPLGYEGIERREKILFSCFAEHGISGGPIFSHRDPQHIYVIGIVTNGLPHCLWDLNAAHRAYIPFNYRFEMGTRMNYICSDIEKKDPKLAQEIFP